METLSDGRNGEGLSNGVRESEKRHQINYSIYFSRIDELNQEEDDETEVFLRECMADPTLRDRISILSRTFQNRKKVMKKKYEKNRE